MIFCQSQKLGFSLAKKAIESYAGYLFTCEKAAGRFLLLRWQKSETLANLQLACLLEGRVITRFLLRLVQRGFFPHCPVKPKQNHPAKADINTSLIA